MAENKRSFWERLKDYLFGKSDECREETNPRARIISTRTVTLSPEERCQAIKTEAESVGP